VNGTTLLPKATNRANKLVNSEVNERAQPLSWRAHLSDFIDYEAQAEGIELPSEEIPEYALEAIETLHVLFSHRSVKLPRSSDEHAKTCYIPPKSHYYGTPQLQELLMQACEEYKPIFNTQLNPQPVLLLPKEFGG